MNSIDLQIEREIQVGQVNSTNTSPPTTTAAPVESPWECFAHRPIDWCLSTVVILLTGVVILIGLFLFVVLPIEAFQKRRSQPASQSRYEQRSVAPPEHYRSSAKELIS